MNGETATLEARSQWRQSLLIYGLLWGLGLCLRLTVLVVPPLIPQLKAVLGFTSGEVAIAISLPLVTLSLPLSHRYTLESDAIWVAPEEAVRDTLENGRLC